jgi:small conductance mechanosensitive channel
MQDFLDTIIQFAAGYGIRILGAIALLVAGRIAAGFARGSIRRVMVRRSSDPTLTSFASSLAYYLIIVFTVVAALSNFGVQVASFVAVLGAAGFAVGFALQGSLSNFAAGVMLLMFRPFKVGDYVTAGGVSGSVKSIDLFSTTLATPDNVKILVPNGKVFGDTIHNYAGYDTRRVDLLIGIGYSSSIEAARNAIAGLITADERILGDPAPMIVVSELADSSVNLTVRVWVNRDHYWPVKFDLTRQIKETFDAQGIEIPFPQRVVHMMNASA